MNTLPLLFPFLPVASIIDTFVRSNAAGQALVVMLMIGSVFAWSIMVTKLFDYRKVIQQSRKFMSFYRREVAPMAMYQQKQSWAMCPLYDMYMAACKELAMMLNLRESEAGGVGRSGTARLTLKDLKAIQNRIEQTMDEQMIGLERNLTVLATTVTAAPFVGLLGSVWGVMDAFSGLGGQGVATLSAVGPGVAGSLLATIVGLVVALPSLIGYNILTARLRVINTLMEHFAQTLISDFERNYLRD